MPQSTSRLKEIGIGAAQGIARMAVGFFTDWCPVCSGYERDGALGAANAINPLYGLGIAWVDLDQATERGDDRATGEAGINLAIGLLGAVAGVVEVGGAVTKVNLNRNTAISRFGIYEIRVKGWLYKIGKADLNRVTASSGRATRVHQQVRKLEQTHGVGAVRANVIEDLGVTTTAAAKQAEAARLRAIYEETRTVPPGNKRSFRP